MNLACKHIMIGRIPVNMLLTPKHTERCKDEIVSRGTDVDREDDAECDEGRSSWHGGLVEATTGHLRRLGHQQRLAEEVTANLRNEVLQASTQLCDEMLLLRRAEARLATEPVEIGTRGPAVGLAEEVQMPVFQPGDGKLHRR